MYLKMHDIQWSGDALGNCEIQKQIHPMLIRGAWGVHLGEKYREWAFEGTRSGRHSVTPIRFAITVTGASSILRPS
jgi:hypothetical protein